MQIVSKSCQLCGDKIGASIDGTYCVSCKGIFHNNCCETEIERCPLCDVPWVNPDELMVFYTDCPHCGVSIQGDQKSCPKCEGKVYSENPEEHSIYICRLKGEARKKIILGTGMILLGLSPLLPILRGVF